jgi:hypothetical protein
MSRSALDAEGWFPTRDAGWIDTEGYLYLTGRADDVIVVKRVFVRFQPGPQNTERRQGRQHHVFEALFQTESCQVGRMEPLHHEHDRILPGIVKSCRQRVSVKIERVLVDREPVAVYGGVAPVVEALDLRKRRTLALPPKHRRAVLARLEAQCAAHFEHAGHPADPLPDGDGECAPCARDDETCDDGPWGSSFSWTHDGASGSYDQAKTCEPCGPCDASSSSRRRARRASGPYASCHWHGGGASERRDQPWRDHGPARLYGRAFLRSRT